MSIRGRSKWILVSLSLVLGVVALVVLWRHTVLGEAATWQRQASPGRLSKGHAFLEDNCAACHTPIKGPEAAKCITCHANDQSVLQRQPTAFHAYIGSCRECHIEHQGTPLQRTVMDHGALAEIGLRQLKTGKSSDGEGKRLAKKLSSWLRARNSGDREWPPHPNISRREALLNCAACHGTKDRHFKLFGQDCAQCHSTAKWTIPEFRHPSAKTTDCAQCHQAPPSHYMGHFRMVSARVARQHHAKVNQCHLCHQTTSWNDIKGVGWYKHH
jgi:hypothetical protein